MSEGNSVYLLKAVIAVSLLATVWGCYSRHYEYKETLAKEGLQQCIVGIRDYRTVLWQKPPCQKENE